MTGQVLSLLAIAISAAGALIDVRSRKLPNWLCLLLGLAAAASAVVNFGGAGLLSSGLHAVIALVLGAALFALKAIGAGDAKFYGAAALAIPLSDALAMFVWALAAGLVVLIAMAAFHSMRRLQTDTKTRWTVPFGLPIFVGFAVALGA